ncbi:MAG: hypothetical protein HON55_02730 [Legionellales bacterium]|nr:hypothetical protein [Legionellales bacterium]
MTQKTAATNADISKFLEPYKYSFKEYSNSAIGYFLWAAPILCGVALAGSIIPFFITTSIPWLMWLSSLTVLIPLVAVSAVVWAAIYFSEIKNITADMFWNSKIPEHQFHDLYKTIAIYKNTFKDASDKRIAKLVVKSFMVKNVTLGDIKAKNENLIAYQSVLVKEQEGFTTICDITAAIDKIEESDVTSTRDWTGDIKNEYEKLKLNETYPIQRTKKFFDVIGWINAVLVNSVGVAISGLSVAAFACDLLFKIGIIASPIIPLAVAVTTTVACFIAGATAAAVLTRIRTRDVGENMAYSFWGWYKSEGKLNIFSTKNLVVFVAILISLAVGIGFAGFNYYTGFYFGSMLVEILSGNMANLIDPKYILDARNTNTLLGFGFALIGFALTIISTSSFLYEVVHDFIKPGEASDILFLDKLKSSAKHYGAILLFTINIATVIVILFINLALLPTVLSTSIITVITLATAISIGLFMKSPEVLSIKNIKEYSWQASKLATILVMAFATAAMGAIGTAKVGSFWYTFLPAALATTSMLQIYGGIVFIGAIIAFPAVFSGAFRDIEKALYTSKSTTATELKSEEVDISSMHKSLKNLVTEEHALGKDDKQTSRQPNN